ncbi:hypothetical protein [Chryseobacterium sp. 22458]|uniref:hypothetical protein n=1 Tax=Chryseobacterium sp. 22458 TaxID=3453921 RepID=UPI003F827E7E
MVNRNLIRSNEGNIFSREIRKSIVSFMTMHHPCSVVNSVEKKYNAYKIHLMDGLCLIFDTEGRYVRTN